MKLIAIFSLFIGLSAFAQTANIKDIPLDKDTNINITTGNKPTTPAQKTWEVVEETTDVAGEPESLSKDARTSWKKACDEWKKETKETNKDNKIITLNCGQPACDKSENVTTTCKSQAKMKVKVKVE